MPLCHRNKKREIKTKTDWHLTPINCSYIDDVAIWMWRVMWLWLIGYLAKNALRFSHTRHDAIITAFSSSSQLALIVGDAQGLNEPRSWIVFILFDHHSQQLCGRRSQSRCRRELKKKNAVYSPFLTHYIAHRYIFITFKTGMHVRRPLYKPRSI